MKTGLESLNIGAPKITYSGNEGPQSPQQMAEADFMLLEEYEKYVFDMEEQGLQPMSLEEFKQQAMSNMADGGRIGLRYGGDTMGGPNDKSNPGQGSGSQGPAGGQSSGGNYGGGNGGGNGSNNRERAIQAAAQSYRAPSQSFTPKGGGSDPIPDSSGNVNQALVDIVNAEQRKTDFLNEIIKQEEEEKDTFDIPKDNFLKTFEKKSIDNFVKRNKYKNLIDSGIYKDFPGLIGKFLGYMNPDDEVEDFDIDSIREIASIYGGDLTPKQARGLEGLRKDFEFEQNYPNATTDQFRKYYNLDDKINIGEGDGPQIYPYPYPINTAMAPGVAPGVAPETAVANVNPFLQTGNLPFADYGTAAHGLRFGVDPRMYAADGGRIGYAAGGIADLRQGYFLGKLVKKATRAVKKIAKSPIGKLALGYLATSGLGSIGSGLTGMARFAPSNYMSNLTNIGKYFLTDPNLGFKADNINKLKAFGGIAALSSLPLIFGQSQEDEEGIDYANLPNIFDKYSPDELRRMTLTGGMDRAQYPFLPATAYAADGGRIGYKEGLRVAALNQIYGINDDEEQKLSMGGSAGLPPITQATNSVDTQSFGDDETTGIPQATPQNQMPMPMPMPMRSPMMSPMMARSMNPMMMRSMNPMMNRGMMNPMMNRGMPMMGGRMMMNMGGGADMGSVNKEIPKIFDRDISPKKKNVDPIRQAILKGIADGLFTFDNLTKYDEQGVLPLEEITKPIAEPFYPNRFKDLKPIAEPFYPNRFKDLKPELMAQGSRIPAQEGGIMMASDILGDESDDISMELYGKPVKDLSPGQLEDFREYLDSLRKDFTSVDDPFNKSGGIMMAGGIEMDANNEIMERIIDDLMEANPSLSIEEAIEEAKKIFNQMASRPMPQADRVMAQEGGMMDMGGMEKDYRNEGGFVAIGGKERADDVPARLSKNEFVFTADAVRNAGGGDIDKGAEIMENMMENLEAGGKVSKASQGLEGARAMFATQQRLEEVL